MSNSTTGQLWSRAAANYKWLVLLRGRGTERVTRRTLCLVSLLAALCALVGAAPSSGSGLADPPPVSAGLRLWYEAEQLPDADGAGVTTWPDGSGSGRDLSAFSAGQAPIMRRGAVNGKAALEFDGVNSLMKTYNSTFTIAQPDTFFVVYKSLDTNSSARAFVFDSRDSSIRQVFGKSGAGQMRLYANQDLDYSGIAYPFDSFEVWNGTFNGSSSVLYRNGTSLGIGNAGAASLAGLSVGGLSTSGQFGYDLAHIQVAEILLYDGTMSAADRQAVTDWLNQKYGLGGPPTPTAPSNTAPPAVTGLARENSTLTATTGTWSGTQPIGYAFRWQHCDANGAACTDIAGATSSTLTLGSTDIGFTIRAVVTATNNVGGQSASSQATAVVTQAPSGSATPPVTAGLQLWFDADSLPDADGAGVTTWPDGSGFGRDLSAFSAGQAPIMRRGAVNGRAALEFDGVNSLMKTYNSTFTIAQPDTFFVVYKSLESNPSGHEAYLWDSRDSSNRQLFGLGPFTNTEMYANIDVEVPTDYPFPDYQVWSGTFQGTSSTVWKNGTLAATGNTGTANMSGLTVGALSTSAQYGYLYGHSLVAEILFYNGSMSASNRQDVTDWLKQKYGIGGTQTPVAPSNTALPTVTGQAIENSTLTATTGTWSGTQPIGYAFQWRRCDTSGNGCVDISGATSNTLTLTSAEVGSTIRAQVTATNSVASQTASSQQTAVVSAAQTSAPPSNTALPTVSGLPRENSTLTATTGTWSGTQPIGYAFQWRRCDTSGNGCVDISGATSNTLTLTSADVGSTIRAQVTATNSVASQTASSQQTAVVSSAPSGSLPPVSAGLQLLYEADSLSEQNGAPVLTWPDGSGFGRDLIAFTSDQAPSMRRGAINGKAALEFDGVNSLMKTYNSTFTIAQPDTFFVVYKSLDTNSPTRAFVFDSRDSSTRQVFGKPDAGEARLYANLDLDFPGVGYPFPSFELFSGTFNGASSVLFRDGSQLGGGNAGGSPLAGLAVGGLSTAGQYGYDFSHIQVAEMLVYSGAMSATDRQTMSDWLTQKYQLPDVTPPTGSITAPAANAVLRQTVNVSSNSADTRSGVASARFEVSPAGQGSWTTIGTASGTPYQVAWNTTTAGDGLNDLRVTTQDVAGNTFTSPTVSVRVDNTAPAVARATAARSDGGGTAGQIRQGSGYYVYAQATDAGSGVAAVTANVNSFDTGVTAASLTTAGGPWTVGGQSYNYRSAVLTANTPLTTGATFSYSVTGTDGAGNSGTASGNSVTVETYSSVVLGTAGLTSYWRLGDAGPGTSTDTFSDSSGTVITSHTGEISASWAGYGSNTTTGVVTPEGTLRRSGTGGASYYASLVPASANYSVECDVVAKSLLPVDSVGVIGRASTSSETYYLARYRRDTTASINRWELLRVVDGVATTLGTFSQTIVVGTTYRLKLDQNGSTIRLLVNGVQRVAATDITLTGAGRAGVRVGIASSSSIAETSGLRLDNFAAASASPSAADGNGTNTGTYTNGVMLGQSGAPVGDANGAASFDGVDDFVSAVRQVSTSFSIEFWFNATQGIGTSGSWLNNAGLVNATGSNSDFGVGLRQDGRITAGVRNGSGGLTSIVSTTSGLNNGAWHHVVFTRDGSTGALVLYVDGASSGTATGPTIALTGSSTMNFGRVSNGSNYLRGILDEVAVYTSVLNAGTAMDHYHSGHGS